MSATAKCVAKYRRGVSYKVGDVRPGIQPYLLVSCQWDVKHKENTWQEVGRCDPRRITIIATGVVETKSVVAQLPAELDEHHIVRLQTRARI